jgi:hypothetical protein
LNLWVSRNAEFDRVIGCVDQILLRAEIPFRSLDRRVTEKQLDLLKLSALGAAELGARAAVMPHAA